MSPDSEQRVRESWQLLEPHAATFAAAFYQHLFDADPAIRHMFDGRSMDAQQLKFVDMLREIVATLDEPKRLISVVAASGKRHGEWGVTPAHYDTVGAAMIAGLQSALGPAFTDDVRHAWLEAYALLAAVMQRGAQH